MTAETGPADAVFPLPMVGRDGEMAMLELLAARAERERTPSVATVLGPPGIGKTRLAEEFCAAAVARRSGTSVVRGRCLPYGSGLTYGPLAETLRPGARREATWC